jgi:hypothetical protein
MERGAERQTENKPREMKQRLHHRPTLVAVVHGRLVEPKEAHGQNEGCSGRDCIKSSYLLKRVSRYLPTYLDTYLHCTHDLNA